MDTQKQDSARGDDAARALDAHPLTFGLFRRLLVNVIDIVRDDVARRVQTGEPPPPPGAILGLVLDALDELREDVAAVAAVAPPHEPPELAPFDATKIAQSLRVRRGEYMSKPTGVACPDCATELRAPLITEGWGQPPTVTLRCPACGWRAVVGVDGITAQTPGDRTTDRTTDETKREP